MEKVKLIVLVLSVGGFTAVSKAVKSCEETCDKPLGISDGRVKDNQLTAFSLADNHNRDFGDYGVENARLNKTSWPQGFRAGGDKAPIWIDVQLGEEKVITGFATQGYGDVSVGQWVTRYKVYYGRGDSTRPMTDESENPVTFMGNKDSNTIVRHVSMPVVASSVKFVINKAYYSQNGPGLRLELYGCEKGYHFVVWMMLYYEEFYLELVDPEGIEYKEVSEEFLNKVYLYLQSARGFHEATIESLAYNRLCSCGGFPVSHEWSLGLFDMTAQNCRWMECFWQQRHIFCIPKRVYDLIGKLKMGLEADEEIVHSNNLHFQFPMSCSCEQKNVNINLAKLLSEARKVVFTNGSFELDAEVQTRCKSKQEYKITWEVSWTCRPNTNFIAVTETLGNSKTLKLFPDKYMTKAELSECYLFIRCVLKTDKDPEMMSGSDYGYLRFVKPLLVASLLGISHVVRGMNSTIRLIASKSRDPLGGAPVSFSWFCRRENEQFTSRPGPPVDESFGMKKDRGGCFGFGPGRHSSNESTLLIDSNKMEGNQTYVFEVVVSKEGRNATASHKVRVSNPFRITVSCQGNCGTKLSTTRRIVLKSTCEGLFCHAIKRYHWNLYNFDESAADSRWTQVDNLEEMILTYLDSPNLVIAGEGKAKTGLQENGTYKASAFAFLSEDFAMDGQIHFLTNLSPRLLGEGTGCFVTPQKGEVLSTEFVGKCTGWWDPDQPLAYQFSVRTNDTGRFILQNGRSNVLRTHLPGGDPKNDYDLIVEVQISDSQGSSTKDIHIVKVRPSSLTDYSDVLMNVSDFLQSGVPEKATQITYCILSDVRDEAKNITREKRSKIKEQLLGQMATVEVRSVVRVSQMASVVDMATAVANEMTELAQEKTLDLQNSGVAFLLSDASSLLEDPDLVQQVAASILPGISNVQNAMRANRQGSEQRRYQENSEEMDVPRNSTSDRRAGLVLKSLHLIDSVGTVLLDTKVCSEKPSNFQSDSFNLTVEKLESSRLSRKSIESSLSKVIMPSAATLFNQTLEGTQAVGTQLLTFQENPYNWHVSSRKIKSIVMDVTLKDSTGQNLNISNIQEPIQLWLPIKTPLHKSKQKFFVKSSAAAESIRYHRVYLPSDDVTANVDIRPEVGKAVKVFVSALRKPTPEAHNLSFTLPDYSSCQSNSPESSFLNCTSSPYVFAVSSRLTGSTGLHFIGIRYNGSFSSAEPLEMRNERKGLLSRDCENHNRRRKRSCVGVKELPTTPPPTMIVRPIYNASTDLNYSMSVNIATCKYWSESKNRWTNEGCKVGLKSEVGKLQCLCTHLTAYGGDLFVEPNPIDFDKVWAAFDEPRDSENFIVLSTLSSILILYIVGLVLARRADKRDHIKVVANVYLNHLPKDVYEYQVQVQTGMWRGYGTTANVGIIVYGEDGHTDAISLNDSNLHKVFFARGSVIRFTLRLKETLGNLIKVNVWHNDGGKNPAWFLQEIVITDSQTKEEWHFLGRRWLAVDRGSGSVRAEIKVAKKTEMLSFKNLVYLRTLKGFLDEHLWLSVLTKAPHDLFSRCQRLSCCILILYTSMLVNAMFYQFRNYAKGHTIKVGPLEIGWTQTKIAIQSSVLAIPVNVLVVLIFRNIRPLKVDRLSALEIPEEHEDKWKLPHCFVYLGWILSSTASLAAAAFTVFYSLIWASETANQWLTSAIISISLDAFLTQPLKVIGIASLLSMVHKKVPPKDKVVGSSLWKSQDNSNCDVIAPEGQDLEQANIYRRKLLQMSKTIKEVGLFFSFVLLLMTFCYGNRTSSGYFLTKSLQDIFAKRSSDKNIPALWNWTKEFLIPGLYNVTWYNGQKFEYEEGFISNREGFIVGMPRLRQLRLKSEESCLVAEREVALKTVFPKCLPSYSAKTEDATPYYQPGWVPVENFSYFRTEYELFSVCPKPWRFHPAEKLQTLSHAGQLFSYGGVGFVADLGYNARSSKKVLHDLEKHRWIDENTAAVFAEFSLFEPSSSYLTSVRYLHERFQTGGCLSGTTVKTVTLYGATDPNYRIFIDFNQLLLILFVMLFAFREVIKIFHQGWAYFRQFWNWIELVEIVAAVSAIAVVLAKDSHATKFVTKVRSNPYETSSIDYILLLTELEVYLQCFVVSAVTVKLLRILRYNRHICQLMCTLKMSIKPLISYMFVYSVAVFPFSQLGFLMFGSSTFAYSTFFKSLCELLTVVTDGTIEFQELQRSHHWLGPIFIFVYVFVVYIIFVNMFVAILLDGHQEMKNRYNKEDFYDAEIGDFMLNYFAKHASVAFKKLLVFINSCLKRSASPAVIRRNAMKRSTSSSARGNRGVSSPQCAKQFREESLGLCGETEINCSCENQTVEEHSCHCEGDHMEDGHTEVGLVGDADFQEIRASLLGISEQLRQSISLPHSD